MSAVVHVHDDARTLAELARRDRTVPGLEVLLSTEALSEALGEPVHITRVRYKPGASVVVAFQRRGTPQWAGAYGSQDKARKILGHAARRGLEAHRLAGVPCGVVASAFADRALWAPLHAWQTVVPDALESASLFRHNPQRRMVFELPDSFVKVAAAPHRASVAVPQALAAQGVPVLVPAVLAPGVSATRRWGSGTLAARHADAHATAAGAAVACMHRAHRIPAPGEDSASRVAETAEREAAVAVAAVAALIPALADRALRIARAGVPTHPAVRLHGDLTADQVLVGSGIRLIDFDRTHAGHPARDLGSFLAGELVEGREPACADAFLDGYRGAGGDADPVAVRRWTARCLLMRAVEPFRRAQPGWTAAMEDAIARAEELVP